MKIFTRIHHYICTFFIFGFVILLSLIPAQFEVLDPISKALSDFELTDLVFSQLREDQSPDTNIVLVNIAHLSRAQIGELVSIINEFNPKVIGLDVFFRSKKDFEDDIQLIMSLSQVENLVMVSELVSPIEGGACFDSLATSHPQFNQFATNGFANMLTAAESYKTTRDFVPQHCVQDSTVLGFGPQIVKIFKPSALDPLLKRNKETEVINWKGHYDKFFRLDAQEVLNREIDLSFLKDKIVLLGYMGTYYLGSPSLEDTFYTPMNKHTGSKTFPDMYGVTVHANIISMILNNDYINTTPFTIDVLIAFLIVFLNVSLFFWVGTHYKLYYDLISKSIQLIEVAVIFFLNLLVLLFLDYKLDLTFAIVCLVFSGDLTELYVGSLQGIGEKAYTKFKKKNSVPG